MIGIAGVLAAAAIKKSAVTLNPRRQATGRRTKQAVAFGSFVSCVLWLKRQDRRGVATSVLGSMNNRRGSLRTSRLFSRMARANAHGATLENVGDSLCPSRENYGSLRTVVSDARAALRNTRLRFGLVAMRLAMRTPGLVDPHFDAFRETWVAVPELWSTARERRRVAFSRERDASL
jgi:hypothetical protein